MTMPSKSSGTGTPKTIRRAARMVAAMVKTIQRQRNAHNIGNRLQCRADAMQAEDNLWSR